MMSDGKPEIQRGKDERRDAERLHRADEQLAAVCDDPRVVQVGVIQANLTSERDEKRLLEPALDEQQQLGLRAQAQPRRQRHGADDERGLEEEQGQQVTQHAPAQHVAHVRPIRRRSSPGFSPFALSR